jgi:hypothetical protein
VSTSPACRCFELDGIATLRGENLRAWTTDQASPRKRNYRGLEIETQTSPSGRGRTFFLTSLFIELIGRPSSPAKGFTHQRRVLPWPLRRRSSSCHRRGSSRTVSTLKDFKRKGHPRQLLITDGMSSAWRIAPQRSMKTGPLADGTVGSMLSRGV